MKGRILRIKHGYNPNSSSMGSIIFALPLSLIALTFGSAAVSSLIFSFFLKDKPPLLPPEPRNKHRQTPD